MNNGKMTNNIGSCKRGAFGDYRDPCILIICLVATSVPNLKVFGRLLFSQPNFGNLYDRFAG
jgi:hypothetical protein